MAAPPFTPDLELVSFERLNPGERLTLERLGRIAHTPEAELILFLWLGRVVQAWQGERRHGYHGSYFGPRIKGEIPPREAAELTDLYEFAEATRLNAPVLSGFGALLVHQGWEVDDLARAIDAVLPLAERLKPADDRWDDSLENIVGALSVERHWADLALRNRLRIAVRDRLGAWSADQCAALERIVMFTPQVDPQRPRQSVDALIRHVEWIAGTLSDAGDEAGPVGKVAQRTDRRPQPLFTSAAFAHFDWLIAGLAAFATYAFIAG